MNMILALILLSHPQKLEITFNLDDDNASLFSALFFIMNNDLEL